jgi:hypothetical protein
VAGWLLVGAAASSAAEPTIQVTPVVADGQVLASFTVPSGFDADAEEVARSGLLLTFTFAVDLRRPSPIWFDRTLGTTIVAASVKFDNLTGVYQVSKLVDGRVVWSDRTQDVAQVRLWVTRFDRVSIPPRTPLEANVEYYVRVRMQTTPRRTLPLWPWPGDAASGRADFTFIR